MIPKIIYQTWKTKNFSPIFTKYRHDMFSSLPDFAVYLFDDNEMERWIHENCSADILNCFYRIHSGAGRADLWRYLIIYKNGGFYLDIDSALTSDFCRYITPLDEGIISRESNSGFFLQWAFGFAPRHPVLKRTIEICLECIKNSNTDNPFWSTGPAIFTLAINQVYASCFGRHVNLYFLSDSQINDTLNVPAAPSHSCRARLKVIGMDFHGVAKFKHHLSSELYSDCNVHWASQIEASTKQHSFFSTHP